MGRDQAQADFEAGADLAIPTAAFTSKALARRRPDRERAVFRDLQLPDDLIGREFRLTVQYRPTKDGETSVVFVGGTVTGFELSDDVLRLHVNTPSFAGRRVECLDAYPAEWVGDNDEWRLVCELNPGERPIDGKTERRFLCHLELLDPRSPK